MYRATHPSCSEEAAHEVFAFSLVAVVVSLMY